MNKLKVAITRFFKNKNTVTILAIILSLAILYFAYNWRINTVTRPVKVLYAKVDIQPRELITEDKIGMFEIPSSMVTDNTIRSITQVVGLYANFNTMIPAGSIFYKSSIVTWEQMPDSAFANIPDGYTIVSLPVNIETTYGNSIFPGNYIDLYFVGNDDTGKLILGRLIESIEVLAVKDSTGKHVFENSAQLLTPSSLIFAVPEELHLLLRKASYIKGKIIPVPRNASYSENPSATKVSSEYLKSFILSQTVIIPDEELPTMEDTTNNDTTTETTE
jgi:Flp pilus assembly protein CpaB